MDSDDNLIEDLLKKISLLSQFTCLKYICKKFLEEQASFGSTKVILCRYEWAVCYFDCFKNALCWKK